MPPDQLYFNGINGSTGGYLMSPRTAQEVSAMARGVPPDADAGHFAVLKKWWNRFRSTFFEALEGIDPLDLAQTGWGVIVAFPTDDAAKARQAAILDALRPLLDLRKKQAGKTKESYYREFTGPSAFRPGESKRDWLVRHNASPGAPADPERVPYYLMIVGGPEEIPFRFQYQLDVEYGVGRVAFDTVEEYARYARSVVEAETTGLNLARRATFFGVRNNEDQATQLSADHLIEPLAKIMDGKLNPTDKPKAWDLGTIVGDGATKARLGQLLGGPETPAFLFTASHGMGFSRDDPRQRSDQGALLCQDWPGALRWPRNQPIPAAHYFAAADVPDDARPHGMIAFHFACYGAGTPKLDDYPDLSLGQHNEIAPNPFLARLPQRLLSHPKGGALAVIGHVERAWGYSFTWPRAGEQLGTFQSVLLRLFNGHPVGSATEYMNQRYAALSVELSDELQEEKFGTPIPDDVLVGLWTSNNDARSYIVLGDPAVRLGVPSTNGPGAADTAKRASAPVELMTAPPPGST